MRTLFLFFLVSAHLHASPVLDGLVKEIESQGKGIVIMDVDETILDTHSRKYQAYLASVKLHCGDFEELEKKSSDCEKLIGLSKLDFYKMSNGYSSYELLARLGISWSELAQKITVSMIDFYLSGRWLEEDSPISGANTFVRRLKRAGATVYFVTSRFEDTQKESSLMRLKELGFLQTGEEDKIIFRKQNEESQAFKARALEVLQKETALRMLPVLGLFENEPQTLKSWIKAFPQARAVLIKGNVLVNVNLPQEVHVIENYR